MVQRLARSDEAEPAAPPVTRLSQDPHARVWDEHVLWRITPGRSGPGAQSALLDLRRLRGTTLPAAGADVPILIPELLYKGSNSVG